MRYARHTGFTYMKEAENYEEAVKQVSHPMPEGYRFHWGLGPTKGRDRKTKDLIKMAASAYLTDGMVKQVVDKYAEMFKDFDFQGNNEKAVKYVKQRFNLLGMQSGEHWKVFISRVILEYIMKGNAMILKYRGYNEKAERRALYKNRPYCLSGFKLMPADKLEPHFDDDNIFDGWIIDGKPGGAKMLKLFKPTNASKDTYVTIIPGPQDPETTLIHQADIAQIAYKKPAGQIWGHGLILSGLEDMALLRSLELTVAIMIKKFSAPLYHHIITQAPILGGSNNAIRDAYLLHQKMAPDGVIITGNNHEIKAIGAESQAIRAEGYLNYFAGRGAIGIGCHPALIGLTKGGVGDTELANEDMLKKVRFCQKDLAWQIKTALIDEILWEGGFDPFNNEDDEVNITFEDIDVEATMKTEAHAADLFNKNAIDHDQLQDRLKTKKPVNELRLYHNMIDKPMIDHEAKAKGDAQKDAGVAIAKAKPKPKTAREIASRYLPTNESELDSYIYYMVRKLGIDKNELVKVYDNLEGLMTDPEAFVELVVQTVAE